MVAASTLGAALGVSVQLYANAVSSREEESARASLAAVLFFSVRVGGSVALAGPCALETAFAERNIPALPWWIGWPFEMRPSASNHTLFHSSPPDAFFFFVSLHRSASCPPSTSPGSTWPGARRARWAPTPWLPGRTRRRRRWRSTLSNGGRQGGGREQLEAPPASALSSILPCALSM